MQLGSEGDCRMPMIVFVHSLKDNRIVKGTFMIGEYEGSHILLEIGLCYMNLQYQEGTRANFIDFGKVLTGS